MDWNMLHALTIKRNISKMDKKTDRTPQLLTQSWNTGLLFYFTISLTALLFLSHIQAYPEAQTYSSYSSPRLAG